MPYTFTEAEIAEITRAREEGCPPGQSHLHVINPSSSARNSSSEQASRRFDLMLALRDEFRRRRLSTI